MTSRASLADRQSGRIVEFVGAAGIGKSRLTVDLLKELKARGVVARNMDTMPSNCALRRVLLLPGAAYLAALARPRSISAWVYATRQLLRYQYMRLACGQIGDFCVTSEGIFHRLRGLSRNSLRLDMVDIADRLLRRIAPPHAVVVLEASADTVLARRVNRQRPGDRFTECSVQDDVALTSRVIETARFIQQTRAPEMQIVIMQMDSTDTATAARILADLLGAGCQA